MPTLPLYATINALQCVPIRHDAMSERIEVRLSRHIAVEPMAKNNMLIIHYIHHLLPIFHSDLLCGLTNKICAYVMCLNSVYSSANLLCSCNIRLCVTEFVDR